MWVVSEFGKLINLSKCEYIEVEKDIGGDGCALAAWTSRELPRQLTRVAGEDHCLAAMDKIADGLHDGARLVNLQREGAK